MIGGEGRRILRPLGEQENLHFDNIQHLHVNRIHYKANGNIRDHNIIEVHNNVMWD